MLRIIARRLDGKDESHLENDQFGSRRGYGTRDGIAVVRTLAERSLEHNKQLYISYVDYEKAVNRVNWTSVCLIDWRSTAHQHRKANSAKNRSILIEL